MILTINGEKSELRDGTALTEYLAEKGYRTERIAVELNMAIVPKNQYPQIVLHDGDALEIVTFMGGG